MTTVKKSRPLVPEKIYDLLFCARTADKITLHLKDLSLIHI